MKAEEVIQTMLSMDKDAETSHIIQVVSHAVKNEQAARLSWFVAAQFHRDLELQRKLKNILASKHSAYQIRNQIKDLCQWLNNTQYTGHVKMGKP